MPAGFSFVTKPLKPAGNAIGGVGWMEPAPTPGKVVELVVPVTYALPAPSTAMPNGVSLWFDPRNVE